MSALEKKKAMRKETQRQDEGNQLQRDFDVFDLAVFMLLPWIE